MICIERGIVIAVPFEKFQNDWATIKWFMSKYDFAKFKFEVSFG